MKKTFTSAFMLALLSPALSFSQVDLTIGLNFSYDPPSNCNNQINNITIDVCNNGNSSSGSFLVGIYLYQPNTQQHWVLDQTTINSLSGNACVTINNWNIDMNNYPSLPAPGTNYRIGVWADTANTVSESDENNNSSLLSGNIQVCGTSGIHELYSIVQNLNVSPNPASADVSLEFSLMRQQNVSVEVYDVNGRKISATDSGILQRGQHKTSLDVSKYEAGFYFVKVRAGESQTVKKLLVTR